MKFAISVVTRSTRTWHHAIILASWCAISVCSFGLNELLAEPAFAALSVVYGSETKVSEDGKFVLVRIDPHNSLEEELAFPAVEPSQQRSLDEKIKSIRTNYPTSGLYVNDGSNKLLWAYDGRWCRGGPIIAPGGEYVIVPGRWGEDITDRTAFAFLHHGQEIRSYYEADLIPFYAIKWILNGRSPPTCVATSFDPQQMTYTIRTNQNEVFVLDITTGKCVAIHSPFATIYYVVAISLVAVTALLLQRWWKKRRTAIS